MKKEKIASVLGGAMLLLLGLGCCLSNGLLMLQPSIGVFNFLGERVDLRREVVGISFLLLLLAIVCTEWSIWWIRKSLIMRDVRGSYRQSNIWTTIARLRLNVGLIISSIAVPMLLILIAGGLVFSVSIVSRDAASLPLPFWVFLGACAAYVVLRIPAWLIWRLVGADVGKLIRSVYGLPKYRLVDGGVAIELYPTRIAVGTHFSTEFRVGFDELDEVRCLSYVEARSYLADIVGPDLDLTFRQIKESYRFPVSIPRPTVYRGRLNAFGANLLLRGPGLFYLIGFNADDASDLVDAFCRHKGFVPTLDEGGA